MAILPEPDPGEQDDRRDQILRSALDVISERGYPDTRISDVAERAGVSPALVIYYFKTKDRLLTEAMRHGEDAWYDRGSRRLSEHGSAARRLEELVAMSTLTEPEDDTGETWAIWLDLWAQSVRNTGVAKVRQEFDEHWRQTIRSIVTDGREAGEFREVDVDEFVLGLSAMLDGFAIQIGLSDPVVTPERAFETSMHFCAESLGFDSTNHRRSKTGGSRNGGSKTGGSRNGGSKTGGSRNGGSNAGGPRPGASQSIAGAKRARRSPA
jgi:AcrR family transcriptional regulator